jgi:hypothetical protein
MHHVRGSSILDTIAAVTLGGLAAAAGYGAAHTIGEWPVSTQLLIVTAALLPAGGSYAFGSSALTGFDNVAQCRQTMFPRQGSAGRPRPADSISELVGSVSKGHAPAQPFKR